MTNTAQTEEMKRELKAILTASFPLYSVVFEHAGEDVDLIGVGVYGVKKEFINWVEERIIDLDEKLCSDTGLMLVPLVRDEETTEKFYPQFIKPWTQRVSFAGLHLREVRS